MNKIIPLILVLLISFHAQAKQNQSLGLSIHQIGKRKKLSLKPCLQQEPCIGSEEFINIEKTFADPIKVISNKERAFEKVSKILLKDKRFKLVHQTSNYIYATYTIYSLVTFDLEFFFPNNSKVHFRIKPRKIPFDLGYSRKIIEGIRFKYHQNDF